MAEPVGDPEWVTLAVPCRTDEPALERTLAAALASWQAAPRSRRRRLEVLVCLNGPARDDPRTSLAAFATAHGAPLGWIDADRPAASGSASPASGGALAVTVIATRRAGKALAWNLLRAQARGACAVFVDADVALDVAAVGRLLDALDSHPEAVLASAKTTCVARPGFFEAVMAAPYAIDFPNLSAQLYAARLAALPPRMPEGLIEPERWLELELGRARVVRLPEVRVAVRLPGTLRDFFKQRIRIEMGKVQLARDYPGLAARGERQPSVPAALVRLGAATSARLGVYVLLRSVAHVVAWWRYRRGATAGIWPQAATTKQWDAA